LRNSSVRTDTLMSGRCRDLRSAEPFRIVRIEEIVEENSLVKTFRFRDDTPAEPGQFYMVWVPGVDEMPMSVSYTGSMKGITVHRIGRGTEALHTMSVGDKIGIRGPYGRPYSLQGKRVLMVAGGTAVASLAPLAEKAVESGIQVDFALGARDKEKLVFVERLEKRVDLRIATDDGSAGYHGFVTNLAKELMEKNDYDMVYACGPEIMLYYFFKTTQEMGVKVQFSLERFMKCGIGVCGSCAIGPYLVCRDGPVFTEKEMLNMPEFGNYMRDAAGRKTLLK
jgi:dihydroorotate dehydrogenase electron transfer subunit